MQNIDLEQLREQIDRLDEELVELLARRFRVTEQVGHLKARQGLQAVGTERESRQEKRLSLLAERHDVNPDLVRDVFRAIVRQVVFSHAAIANQRQGS